MDTPSYTVPNTRPSTTPSGVSQKKALIVLAVIILVALAGFLAYRAWDQGSLFGTSPIPDGMHVVLTADEYPAPAARVLDLRGDGLLPVTVEGQGSATVLDVFTTPTHSYYLLSGPGVDQSTLYKQELANKEAGLSQVTSSATRKIDLSYDDESDVVAYTLESGNGSPHVGVWDATAGRERDLGEGMRPTVLRYGSYVVFERDGALVSHELASSKTSELLVLGEGSAFTVDPLRNRVAVYDPSANVVNHYVIGGTSAELALELSEPITEAPDALLYSGDTLLAARSAPDTLILSTLDGNWVEEIPTPGLSLDGLSLSLRHDQ